MSLPRVLGVRTARKLLAGFGLGIALIALCSVLALLAIGRLNAMVRHLAFDPVPGAAIAGFAKDFNQYRVLEASGPASDGTLAASLALKAADIARDLKACDDTITLGQTPTPQRAFG